MPHTLTFQPDEWPRVLAAIDGVPITTIIADYESQNTLEGHRKGYTSGDVSMPRNYINYTDSRRFSFDGSIADLPLTTRESAVILVCACTYPECGSTTVDMQVTDTHVIWSNLKTRLNKQQPYPNLGPWTFDLTQYRKACEDLHTQLKATHQPPSH